MTFPTIFGPDLAEAGQKTGATAEAARPKEHQMLDNIVKRHALQTLLPQITPPQATITFAGTVEMTPAEWDEVPPNGRQRDTVRHAKRATHLKTPHPTHAKVNMAVLPDGSRIKLDGHTRSYLWKNGEVEPPVTIYADVWNVPSRDVAGELYTTFDSRAALETSPDQVFGAMADLGLSFTSELLKSNCFTLAMRLAYEMLNGQIKADGVSIYDLLKHWRGELALLDECAPKRWRFNTGATVAALLTFRRYGRYSLDFWKAYSEGTGIKLDGQLDAVQALEERMMRYRANRRLVGVTNIKEIARVCLSAFERSRSGEYYDQKSGRVVALGGDSFNRWLKKAADVRRGE